MDTYADLAEALTRIRAAAVQTAVWPRVKEFAARLGYSHVLVLDLTRMADAARAATLHSDGPAADWAFEQEMTPDRDQVIRSCLQTSETFLISSARNGGPGRGTSPADVVRNGEGLVVPVYRDDKPVAAASFWGARPDTSPLARSLLLVVSHAASERSGELRAGRPAHNVLSARETQCLRQVASGRPDAEIGQVLGISARTVRFHIDSAKTKLGASTRIQAVAKALRERLIAV